VPHFVLLLEDANVNLEPILENQSLVEAYSFILLPPHHHQNPLHHPKILPYDALLLLHLILLFPLFFLLTFGTLLRCPFLSSFHSFLPSHIEFSQFFSSLVVNVHPSKPILLFPSHLAILL